jgi:hypothetical protein
MKNTPEYHLQTIGAALLMIGYFILLYVDVLWGCMFRFIANICLIPYPLKMKYWNLVFLEGFFIFVDFSKIIQILFLS